MSTPQSSLQPNDPNEDCYGSITPTAPGATGHPTSFGHNSESITRDDETDDGEEIMTASGNVGILACYVGLALIGNVMDAPFTVYLVRHLNASPTQQTAVPNRVKACGICCHHPGTSLWLSPK